MELYWCSIYGKTVNSWVVRVSMGNIGHVSIAQGGGRCNIFGRYFPAILHLNLGNKMYFRGRAFVLWMLNHRNDSH